MKLKLFLLSLLTSAGVVAAPSSADEPLPYPLKTCIVADEPLGDDPVSFTHRENGKPDRVVMFCCEGCIEDFKQEPAKFLAKLDAAPVATANKESAAPAKPAAAPTDTSVAAQKANYPLKVCAVSGEALGSMGDPYEHVHRGDGEARLVLMCCKGCLKTFNKEPAKYIARIDAAAKKTSASAAAH